MDNNYLQKKLNMYSAWYSADPYMLARAYNRNVTSFWCNSFKKDRFKVHIPIASDIATTSASYLFGEEPNFMIPEAREVDASVDVLGHQELLDRILLESNLYPRILEGAELCSALGGVFLKIVWDTEISDYPIIIIEQPDTADPTFKLGQLSSVDFTRQPTKYGNSFYQVKESYNVGSISYKMERVFDDGSRPPQEVELTEELKQALNVPDDVFTGVEDLLVYYVPNMLPNRINRTSYIGRSDYQGLENLFEMLDRTYSAWNRELELSKSKIYVPQQYLKTDPLTGKLSYDYDEDIYVVLEASATDQPPITPQQFIIRSQQYLETCINLIEQIVTFSGHNLQAFGLSYTGMPESGTALHIREKRSFTTKSKKENYWRKPLKKLVQGLLAVYNTHLGGTFKPYDISLTFADGITVNNLELAHTLQALRNSNVASIETCVRLLNPDWSEKEVQEETEKLSPEFGLPDVFDFNQLEMLETETL